MTSSDMPMTPAVIARPQVTHFVFQARVFQAPGAHFSLVSDGPGRPKKPMFGVEMGTAEAVISLKDLRENFGIAPDSLDDHLIATAEAGLHYVPDIRPGDAIPTELLNGTASWTVSRKHKRMARERIQGQLLAWVSGKPVDTTDRTALEELMNKPETKKMLREAFRRAAVALGLKVEDSEQVIDRIETLSRELCYVEALRDRFGQVSRIRQMLDRLIKAYTNDQRMVDEINRCKVLIAEGWREIQAPLVAIDAKIGNVMEALQTIDAAIDAIRQTRDDVHFILMHWDPVIARWESLAPEKSQPSEKAILVLYRMLASRFPTGRSLLSPGRVGRLNI